MPGSSCCCTGGVSVVPLTKTFQFARNALSAGNTSVFPDLNGPYLSDRALDKSVPPGAGIQMRL